MHPLVSVIIPAYNVEKYIGEAIDSVIAQTFSSWECVIVNDGSADNTGTVVKSIIAGDARFIYLEQSNSGPALARNTGIAQARGTYILPLDGDDKISSNYVEECVKVIQSSEKVKVATATAQKFGTMNGRLLLPDFSMQELLFQNILHCTSLYRKNDWQKIGGYDTKMTDGCEDWEFWIRLLKDGGDVVCTDKAVFFWRRKEVSRTTQLNNTVKLSRLLQYIYCKHAALYEPYFSNPLDLYKKLAAVKNDYDWAKKHPFKFLLATVKRYFKNRGSNAD